MDQLNQLKQMRDDAQKRIQTARDGIKQQLLALENSADAKLVKSLGVLIADLELLSQPVAETTAPSAATVPVTEKVEDVAQNALADALGAQPKTAKADTLSELTEQLRGTLNAGN